MAKDPGTYRVRDGSPVAFSVALDQRVPVAHAALIDTARSYRGLTTYLELAEHVQAVSGVRTRMLIGYWSGQLLERVAQLTVERAEVPITSLCVHQDGTIGGGYATAPQSVKVDEDVDVDELAAAHRLLCYRKYATDLPADGGEAALAPKLAAARARRESTHRTPAALCPEHFMELSASGVCAACE
ncbi:MAG: hypothetical protein IPL94_13790 [Tetrasphaera sp.]|nr:hypothetical protein [Tetrasphaera sp.]